MAIVGFGFTKFHVERNNQTGEKINISNNVAVKDIQKIELKLGPNKQNALKFLFQFSSTYKPEVGNIEIGGEVVFLPGNDKERNEILDGWKKNQKLKKEVITPVLNTVLSKCNIEALLLSKEVNLPPPMPMPQVQTKNTANDYIG